VPHRVGCLTVNEPELSGHLDKCPHHTAGVSQGSGVGEGRRHRLPRRSDRSAMPAWGERSVADDDLLTERLLRVINEGRRTASYKLALSLARRPHQIPRPQPRRLLRDCRFPQGRRLTNSPNPVHRNEIS